jgi:hypothetical protein
MKLSEAIEIIETQAANHPAAASAPTGFYLRKDREWIKSITALNKDTSDGYSLIGDFWKKTKDLEPGLFLIFTVIAGSRIVKESQPKRERGTRNLLADEEGNIVFHEVNTLEPFVERRGLLFDFDGQDLTLLFFTWLPSRQWARELWKPVEVWLEKQPNIEAKIKFWEKEVELHREALRQAEQRLSALKRQIATDDELDPGLNEWLKTAAVLGTKKATE